MRTLAVSLAVLLAPALAEAQVIAHPAPLEVAEVEYRLGGAAETSGIVRDTGWPARFPLRTPAPMLRDGASDTAFGRISIFGGETREDGREGLNLGTALIRGKTTTGISLTFPDAEGAIRQQVFADHALSGSFSIGVAGDWSAPDAPLTRLGISAAYLLDGGSFVQGSLGGSLAGGTDVGLSVGLRF